MLQLGERGVQIELLGRPRAAATVLRGGDVLPPSRRSRRPAESFRGSRGQGARRGRRGRGACYARLAEACYGSAKNGIGPLVGVAVRSQHVSESLAGRSPARSSQGCDKLRSLPGLEPAPVLLSPPPPGLGLVWLLAVRGRPAGRWRGLTLEPAWGGSGTALPSRPPPHRRVRAHRPRGSFLPLSCRLERRFATASWGRRPGWFTSREQAANGPIQVLVLWDNRTNNGDHAPGRRAAAAEHPQLALLPATFGAARARAPAAGLVPGWSMTCPRTPPSCAGRDHESRRTAPAHC